MKMLILGVSKIYLFSPWNFLRNRKLAKKLLGFASETGSLKFGLGPQSLAIKAVFHL